jgi:hypothetical protein
LEDAQRFRKSRDVRCYLGRHRLGTDLRSRICLPALGSLPITRRREQEACFADGDPGSDLRSHYVPKYVKQIAALMLLRGADFLSVFDKRQLEALAILFLDLHRYGYVVGWILGLWLFPLGVLVFRSGFLPASWAS